MPVLPLRTALLLLLSFSSSCMAQDDEARALYQQGKSAYDEGQGTGCVQAVPLLKKYLASYTPTPELAKRIEGAINWCEGFLQDQERFSRGEGGAAYSKKNIFGPEDQTFPRTKEGFTRKSFSGQGWCGQIPASICMELFEGKPKLPD